MQIDIQIEDPRWEERNEGNKEAIEKTILHVLRFLGEKTDEPEVSVTLTNDKDIQILNKNWRGKDAPTNVLSFPQEDEENTPFSSHLGDIILAFETIEREAKEQSKKLNDHFTHLLIHGTLHLMGYDHENDEDAEKMEQLEIDILLEIGIKNPYE